jgi:hypothetical protein
LLKEGENYVQLELSTYDKIHKISFRERSDSYQVACAAGRELLLVDIVDNKFQNTRITRFSDWIQTVKVLRDGSVAVMTAHNLVALLKTDDGKTLMTKKLRCDESSTLYCSAIHGEDWNELLFFGGTALGELVVWKKGVEEGDSHIIHRQFLHNGVIFCIDYNGKYLVKMSLYSKQDSCS